MSEYACSDGCNDEGGRYKTHLCSVSNRLSTMARHLSHAMQSFKCCKAVTDTAGPGTTTPLFRDLCLWLATEEEGTDVVVDAAAAWSTNFQNSWAWVGNTAGATEAVVGVVAAKYSCTIMSKRVGCWTRRPADRDRGGGGGMVVCRECSGDDSEHSVLRPPAFTVPGSGLVSPTHGGSSSSCSDGGRAEEPSAEVVGGGASVPSSLLSISSSLSSDLPFFFFFLRFFLAAAAVELADDDDDIDAPTPAEFDVAVELIDTGATTGTKERDASTR